MSPAAYLGVGVPLILLFGPSVIWPRAFWNFHLFGSRWMFAEPDRLEPSGCAIAYYRLWGVAGATTGLVLLVIGIVSGIRGPVVEVVDTGPGTAGAYAIQLDKLIRQRAAATGLSTRDRALAHGAIEEVNDELAARYCARPGNPFLPPTPSASPRVPRHAHRSRHRHSSGPRERRSPSPGTSRSWSPSELYNVCVAGQEALSDADRPMYPARDYPATGDITVQIGFDPMLGVDGIGRQTVCLTVAQNPSATGKIRAGSCHP